MGKKMLRILAAALCLAAFSIPANADLLFTRQDNGYSNTALGIFHGTSAPVSPLISNMGGNAGQGLYSFKNADGAFRVAVSLYTGNGTDVISIYDPGEQQNWTQTSAWSAPIREATTTLHNTRALVELDGNLYATAYDIPIVSRITTAGDVYKQDMKYEYYHNDSKYDGHGEALVAYNGNLYGIFTGSDDPWNLTSGSYRLNELVKLDKDLSEVATVTMEGKNLDGFTPGAYCLKGSKLYVATMGGVQPFGDKWNTESRIEIVDLDTMEVETLVTAEDVNGIDSTFTHMFNSVIFAGDKIYIQAAKWTSQDEYAAGYSIRLYETTEDKLKEGDIGELVREFTGDYGYRVGLVYDEATKYLWVAAGYSIWRYDGSNWTEFDSDALKGNISAFAAVDNGGSMPGDSEETQPPATDDGNGGGGGGGGGGCNSGWGGSAILALAFVPVIIRHIKR